MDFGQRRLVPFSELVEEMIELLTPDAEEMGCVDEVRHVRRIVMDGTSAERQLWAFRRAINQGATEQEALVEVVDMLAANTAANLT